MFQHMTGRRLAAWGYGFFWFGLLFETVDAIISAKTVAPLSSPLFWAGQVLTVAFVATAFTLLAHIQRRPW